MQRMTAPWCPHIPLLPLLGLVVRPGGSAANTTLPVFSRSDSTSHASAIADWPSTKVTEHPVAAAVLPSPPPFVSKLKHRQRHSVVDPSQPSQAREELPYSSQLDGSTSPHSATVSIRPLLSVSQLPSNHFDHSPIQPATAIRSIQPTSEACAVRSPGRVDALDGGFQYSDPKYFPPTMPYPGMYPPPYSMYYPHMPSMHPFLQHPTASSSIEKASPPPRLACLLRFICQYLV